MRRRWGRQSHVIYPPVDFATESGQKEQLILSVGRFFDQDCGRRRCLPKSFRAIVVLFAAAGRTDDETDVPVPVIER